MKIVAIAGGKGGTGKTFVALNLAYLALSRGYRTLFIDADVDNPSANAVLKPSIDRSEDVATFVPSIDASRCRGCAKCVSMCPEHALVALPTGRILVIEDLCSGCGLCRLVCPFNAITERKRVEGWIRVGSWNGMDVVVGELAVGSRKDAIVIKKLMDYASSIWSSHRYDYVFIDSPPGTGAKLYPIAKASKIVVVVTEPTPLGVSDLRKFFEFLESINFVGKIVVVLNKRGLSERLEDEVRSIARSRNIPLIEIPYSRRVAECFASREIYVRRYGEDAIGEALKKLFDYVESM